MKKLRNVLVLCFGMVAGSAFAAISVPAFFEGMNLSSGHKEKLQVQGFEKPTVVVFMSSKCPCSKSHEPELAALAKEFPQVRFVGIQSNVDESEQKGLAHFEKVALGYPVIHDPHAKIAAIFGAEKTPHVFVIAAGGKEIVYRGAVTDAHRANQAKRFYLKETLAAVVAGKKPPVAEANALGCYIKKEE